MNAIREVKVGAIQPPGGDFETVFRPTGFIPKKANRYVIDWGIKFLKMAAQEGADAICLPELFNAFALDLDNFGDWTNDIKEIIYHVEKIAQKYSCYIVLPILEPADNGYFYNTALLLNRQGRIIGRYRKTHITDNEKCNRILPGDEYPVFQVDFGIIGIMTCWDSFFPEVARILTLKGAEILFHPRWISGPSEISHEIMIRARAIDYSVYIVSSSYGVESKKAWKPGMFLGRSKIINPDGVVIADAGHYAGYITARIDLDKPVLMDMSDKGGNVQDLRLLKLRSRRPNTYQVICEHQSRRVR